MADEIPNGSLHAPGSGGSGAAGAAYENSVHAAKRHKGDEEPRVEIDSQSREFPPSKVVHVRGLPDYCQEADVANAFQSFGAINYIVMLGRARQALVEMSTQAAAVAMVKFAGDNPLFICGKRVYLNFSKSQELQRKEAEHSGHGGHGGHGGLADPDATNILLMTVLNPQYPITTDAIHTICTPYGRVLRIVIFIKRATQVLVEFDTVNGAARAKTALDGADIYAGCCTLRIEYSRTERLNVRHNDDLTWDYTIPSGVSAPAGYRNATATGRHAEYRDSYADNPPQTWSRNAGPDGGPSPVLMVYALDQNRFNAERLFNIFCLYGNVIKVKFLLTRPGTAMVQMGDGYSAEGAMSYLQGISVFGQRLELRFSKHMHIGGSNAEVLPDGTPHCVDFSQSTLNRFIRGGSKNRICPPARVLHFFNAPMDVNENGIRAALDQYGAVPPVSVTIFDKGDGRPQSGLIEFARVEEAVETLVLCNHIPFTTSAGHEMVLKLAFSHSHSNPRRDGPRY